MNDSLDLKATEVFAGKVVRKDLVRKIKVGANIPVFVVQGSPRNFKVTQPGDLKIAEFYLAG